MGSFVMFTSPEEDKKLQLYMIKYKLPGKVEALKRLIADIKLEVK